MLQLCILTFTESGNTATIIVAETQNLRKPPIFLVLKMNMSKTTMQLLSLQKKKNDRSLLSIESLPTITVCGTYQLKEASVREANATPPTIGTRVATTNGFGTCLTSQSAKIPIRHILTKLHRNASANNMLEKPSHVARQNKDQTSTRLQRNLHNTSFKVTVLSVLAKAKTSMTRMTCSHNFMSVIHKVSDHHHLHHEQQQ
jgi:hypothetical protein